MGLANGPISFQRFHIDGRFSQHVDDELVAAIQHRAFGRTPPAVDDTQIGWVGPRHVLETDIDARQIASGRFVHLSMRIDRLRPPPAVLRSYVFQEEQAMREASGRDLLHRKQRRQAREQARLRAEQEARSGAFRRISAVPVLIDLAERVVYLGALGTTVADKLIELFRDTFAAPLEPVDVDRLATNLLLASGDTRQLDTLAPFSLVEPPDGASDEDTAPLTTDLSFLGKELLTWLWYRCDAGEAGLHLQRGDEVAVMIEKTLRMRCDFALTGTDVIMSESPTRLPEARAALGIGKQPTKAGLIIGSPSGEFRLTLDGPRLAVSSLILPEPPESDAGRRGDDQAAGAALEQRFELLADAASLLDALFEVFLRERISDDWPAQVRKMSAWARGQAAQRMLVAARA